MHLGSSEDSVSVCETVIVAIILSIVWLFLLKIKHSRTCGVYFHYPHTVIVSDTLQSHFEDKK